MNAQETFDDFLAQQGVIGYTLGDITGSVDGDMTKYTELKIAVAQENNKIKAFNEQKEIAFNTLAKQHDDERIALGVLWSGYENNNYTIPQ